MNVNKESSNIMYNTPPWMTRTNIMHDYQNPNEAKRVNMFFKY